MSWTRGLIALLAVCVVLMTGSVSCGAGGAQEGKDGQSVSPVGKVLDDTDEEGRHYREVDKDIAPDVGIEVQPTTDDSWSVRLTVENFTFSPTGTKAKAVSGRGVAVVFVDDRPVTTLRTPSCRLAAAYVPQGTHKVTARLYADDGTVWAVDGDPVESTADVTASKTQPTGSAASDPQAGGSAGGASESQAGRSAGGGGSGSRLLMSMGGGASEVRPTMSAVADAPDPRLAVGAGGGAWEMQAMASAGGGVRGPLGGVSAGDAASGSSLVMGAGGGGWEVQAMVSAGGGVPDPEGGAASDVRLATRAGGGR
ncbi:hypothetical protein OG426_12825 [Streptomyces canus]|uniref:hypothetical protein n=1 Tax=Streptomyces canus TaxID=58343 RepID=UPI00225B3F6A|nr:hypothetical protein [Streptomyces canus]MCX4861571.1 hypothetical protein [Streptomyces canus]WSW33288.1 hypothetical protein OG426_12825 [Streptomyces canus]